jgi:hypothetical protein
MKTLSPEFNGLAIQTNTTTANNDIIPVTPRTLTIPSLVPTNLVDANNPKNTTIPVMLVNPTAATVTNGIQVAFSVSNGQETLPLATVQIDNQFYATTENGYFRKPDINPNSVVTISYIGYNAKTFKANAVPSTIVLSRSTTVLPEATVGPKPTTPTPSQPINKKSNLLGWSALALLTGFAIKKATEKPKKQRVKIKKA